MTYEIGTVRFIRPNGGQSDTVHVSEQWSAVKLRSRTPEYRSHCHDCAAHVLCDRYGVGRVGYHDTLTVARNTDSVRHGQLLWGRVVTQYLHVEWLPAAYKDHNMMAIRI